MSDARSSEATFFDKHPEYREVRHQCGIANLAKSLNSILVEHIKTLLPKLRSTIEAELDNQVEELMGYGEAPVDNTPASRCSILVSRLFFSSLDISSSLCLHLYVSQSGDQRPKTGSQRGPVALEDMTY